MACGINISKHYHIIQQSSQLNKTVIGDDFLERDDACICIHFQYGNASFIGSHHTYKLLQFVELTLDKSGYLPVLCVDIMDVSSFLMLTF